MPTLELKVGQSREVTATPVDAGGNAATLTGEPSWTHDGGSKITIAVDAANKLKAVITANQTGVCDVTVEGQASPFPENARASASFTVAIAAGVAVGFAFAFGPVL